MPSAAKPKPTFTISVKELVEFVHRRGDLAGDGQFVGSDRAVQGIRGHQKIQRSRPAGYETEIPVQAELASHHSKDLESGAFRLVVKGRIDGLLRSPEGVLLEEIKTVHGRWDGQADSLHWAQAKIYASMLARQENLGTVTVRLTYLVLETQRVTEFTEVFSATVLREFFESTTTEYLDWLREQARWQAVRDESVRALAFPFPAYRPGQRAMAVLVYKVLANGDRGFIAAPTGIGKTISALFPAVKALGEGKLKRIYYLTARTVGRGIAEKALRDLRTAGLRLRAVTLTARAKVCVRDGHPCDVTTCPLAVGYYDRRRPAMTAALAREEITREVLEEVGGAHQVCPFALAQDISLWADVVIGDYNHVFDPQAYLQTHFTDDAEDFGFLVDEAHNLVDRAREMFSEELDAREINEVREAIGSTGLARCKWALSRLAWAMKDSGMMPRTNIKNVPLPDAMMGELFGTGKGLGLEVIQQMSKNLPAKRGDDTGVLKEYPAGLTPVLEEALEQMENWLARNEPAPFREALLNLYFRGLSFQRTAELYDERYVTLVDGPDAVRIRLFCLDPSHLLRRAMERGRATVFFSATLAPLDYYRDVLGGEVTDPFLQLASPFPPENLAVLVNKTGTTFQARGSTMPQVAAAIGALVTQRRGNYLVYFPSYQYLQSVRAEFTAQFPDAPVLEQKPEMSERERAAYIAAFETDDGTERVGFAVLGGIFGEGIDLTGERLIGVVVVTVGIPQISRERDLIRDYFEVKSGNGFDYAYKFPGMNRVLQAAGRVIRTETDRGVVLLIDERFAEPRYRQLFPAWWRTVAAGSVEKIKQLARSFWEGE